MAGSVRTIRWLFVFVALACGEGADGTGSIDVVRTFSDPDAGVAYAGTWRFANGSELSALRLVPATVRGEGPVSIALTGRGLCGGRLGLLPPRAASRQEVYRGDALDYGEDARQRWVELAAGDGEQAVDIPLARPFHPDRAVLVFEQDCGGSLVPVVAGARGEVLRDGAPVPGGRALLGMVEVAREPTQLTAPRGPVTVDGVRNEPVWSGPGVELVTSLEGEPAGEPRTRVWFAWDERALFVAAELADADVWSELSAHDDPLYRQEAFEVFVAGADPAAGYLEFQVSARNVTFDAHFPRYRDGDEAWDSAWTTAVTVRGSVNERSDRDEGWTVEAAIPWSEICERTGATCPIGGGASLRVNAFRLEKPDRKRQEGYALSPTLVPDFHAWQNAATLGIEG